MSSEHSLAHKQGLVGSVFLHSTLVGSGWLQGTEEVTVWLLLCRQIFRDQEDVPSPTVTLPGWVGIQGGILPLLRGEGDGRRSYLRDRDWELGAVIKM